MNEYYTSLYDKISERNLAMVEENGGISYFSHGIKGTKFENGDIEFCDLNREVWNSFNGRKTYKRLNTVEVILFYKNGFL